MSGKRQSAALVAEFLGTFTLTAGVLAMVARTDFAFFPAITAGLIVAIAVITLGGVSGAHLNPAITVGLWTQRRVKTVEAIGFIATQLLGAIAALRLMQWFQHIDKQIVPQMTNVDARVIVAEAIGTFLFAIGIAAALERGLEGGQKAAAIGSSLTIGIIVASLGSAGILNPAVAFGLSSVKFSYIAGPVIGSVIGMGLYAYLFAPEKAKSTKKKPTAKKKK